MIQSHEVKAADWEEGYSSQGPCSLGLGVEGQRSEGTGVESCMGPNGGQGRSQGLRSEPMPECWGRVGLDADNHYNYCEGCTGRPVGDAGSEWLCL